MAPMVTMGGNDESTIIEGNTKVPKIQTALVNGTTADTLDYDDTLLGISHPGS